MVQRSLQDNNNPANKCLLFHLDLQQDLELCYLLRSNIQHHTLYHMCLLTFLIRRNNDPENRARKNLIMIMLTINQQDREQVLSFQLGMCILVDINQPIELQTHTHLYKSLLSKRQGDKRSQHYNL